MKHRNEAGFSLIEVLVAISILAVVVLPICSALVLSVRMNERTDVLMHDQLAVSSAVETLMAEGIPTGTPATAADGDYGKNAAADRFPDVVIQVSPVKDLLDNTLYYNVSITSNDKLVAVTTSVQVRKEAGT